MTRIYMALSGNDNAQRAIRDYDWTGSRLGLLVSMEYLKLAETTLGLLKGKPRTMLDSGAYSAWNAGRTVNIDVLIKEGQRERWDEVVALDVIEKAAESRINAIYMKSNGSKAFPVFHFGDPWEDLLFYKAHWPKVGLSCLFGEPRVQSHRWLEQCFARAYPHKFHSFGWVQDSLLMRLPFHSADCSSWEMMPTAFGTWGGYGNTQLSIPNGKIKAMAGGLVTQLRVYERLAEKVGSKWRSEFQRQGWLTSGSSGSKPADPPRSST